MRKRTASVQDQDRSVLNESNEVMSPEPMFQSRTAPNPQSWPKRVCQGLVNSFEQPKWMSKGLKFFDFLWFLGLALASCVVLIDPKRDHVLLFLLLTLCMCGYAWVFLHIEFNHISFLPCSCLWVLPLLGVVGLLSDDDSTYMFGALSGLLFVTSGFLVSLAWLKLVLEPYLVRASDSQDRNQNRAQWRAHILMLTVLTGFYADYVYLGYAYFAGEDFDELYQHGVVTASVYFAMIMVVQWVPIHNTVFKLEESQEHLLVRDLYTNNPFSKQAIVQSAKFLEGAAPSGCWLKLYNNTHRAVSAVIIVSLVTCEITVGYMASSYKRDYSTLSACYFFLCAGPMSVYCGLSFVTSSHFSKNMKTLWITIVGALVTSASIILSRFMEEHQHFKLASLLKYGVAIVFLFWLTQTFIYKHNKRLFQLLNGIACLGLGVPIGCIMLFFSDWYLLALGSAGTAVLMLLLFKVFPQCRAFWPLIKLSKLQENSSTWHELIQYIVSTGLIAGLTVLIVVALGATKEADQARLWAACLLVVCAYIVSSLIHESKLYMGHLRNNDPILVDVVLGTVEDKGYKAPEVNSYKTHRRRLRIFWGVICACSIIILVIGAATNYPVLMPFGLFSLLGSVAIALISMLVLYLKHFLMNFGKVYISYLCGCCWCFVLFPMLVLIPIFLAILGDGSANEFAEYAMGFVFILIMIGVAGFSMFINSLLNRMDEEKQKMKVVKATTEHMNELGIRVDREVVFVLYYFLSKLEKEEAEQRFAKLYDVANLSNQSNYCQYVLRAERLKQLAEAKRAVSQETTTQFIQKPEQDQIPNEDRETMFIDALLAAYSKAKEPKNETSFKQLCSCLRSTPEEQSPDSQSPTPTVTIKTRDRRQNHYYPNRLSAEKIDEIRHSQWFIALVRERSLQFETLIAIFEAFAFPKKTLNYQEFKVFANRTFLSEKGVYKTKLHLLISDETTEISAKDFAEWVESSYLSGEARQLGEWIAFTVKQLFRGLKGFILAESQRRNQDPNVVRLNHADLDVNLSISVGDNLIVGKLISCFVSIGTKVCMFPDKQKNDSIPPPNKNPERKPIDFQEIQREMVETIINSKDDPISQEKMQLNCATILGIIENTLEILGLATIAFDKAAGWNDEGVESIATYGGIASEDEKFTVRFIIMAALILVFFFLMRPLISKLRDGTLGRNSAGQPARYKDCEWWFEKIAQLLGKGLYMFIVATSLSATVCKLDGENWVMLANEDITCFEDQEHWFFLVIGLIGILIYYPYASLVYPMLQIKEEMKPIRYESTYAVFEAQCKIFIAGLLVFLDSDEPMPYALQLSATIVACLVLSVYTWKALPCLLEPYNRIKALSLLIPVVCCAGALFRKLTSPDDVESSVILSLMFAFCAGILVVMTQMHCWLENNCFCFCIKKRGQPIEAFDPDYT